MVYLLIGTKPLAGLMMTYCRLKPWEQTTVNLNQHTKIVMQESAFENIICKMSAILFKSQVSVSQR